MKQPKINLLATRKNYQKIERYFFFVRISTFILFALFLILISYFFINVFIQNNTINSLLTQKKSLLESLKNRSDDEAKISYIQKKYQDLKEFLKDDAYSYPYYNLLSSAIASGTQSATLRSFQIAKNRQVNFTISSDNLQGLLSFLRFVESEKFLNNFQNLSLKSFTAIGGDTMGKENYELLFLGKFIELNENNN